MRKQALRADVSMKTKYKEYTLGAVVQILKNNSLSKKDLIENSNFNVRVLHYGNIHTKINRVVKNVRQVSFGVKNANEVSLGDALRQGDIVLTDASEDTQELLKPALIKEKPEEIELYGGLHTIPIRVIKGTVDPEYLSIYLLSPAFKKRLRRHATGIKVYGISKSSFKKLKIYLPSLPEQRKIAAFFSTLDDLIVNIKKQKEKLEELKKGLMQRLFPKKGERIPKLRFKGFEGEWGEMKLGEMARILNGNKMPKWKTKGKYGIVFMGSIDSDGQLNITRYTNNANSIKLLRGDLVMVKDDIGNGQILGRVAIIKSDNVLLGDHVFLIRVKKRFVIPQFLRFYINSGRIHRELLKLAHGTSQIGLSKQVLVLFKISLPSFSEQRKIAKLLRSLEKRIHLKQQQLNKLEHFKKGLMQKMFI